jgi:hypothetical protein
LNSNHKINGFELVRRPSSAIEKAAPGAKHVLAGMVAETIALAETKALIEVSPSKSPLLESWYRRGIKHYFGKDMPQNYSEAVKWWRKAAERGHAKAQYNLSICYADGEGVSQDYTEATKWLYKAAQNGVPNAQVEVGWAYQNGHHVNGHVVPQNTAEAVKWYRQPRVGAIASACGGRAGATGGIGNGLHQGEIARGCRASRVVPALREHYQKRDRLRLTVDYRQKFLDSLTRGERQEGMKAEKISSRPKRKRTRITKNWRRRRTKRSS